MLTTLNPLIHSITHFNMGGSAKSPAAPPPPPPPPSLQDAAAAVAKSRKQAEGRSGRSSTILAGANPLLGAANTVQKTLLGQ